jgi:hypothetical protein
MAKGGAAALILAVALAASANAQEQSSDASLAQDLANCTGAVAAYADADVMAYPRGANGEWGELLGVLIVQMNSEPGIEGMTGRIAANAALSHWAEQPRAAQEVQANACRTRFGRV